MPIALQDITPTDRCKDARQNLAKKLYMLSDKIRRLAAEIQSNDHCQKTYAMRALQELDFDLAGFPAANLLEFAAFQRWGEGVLLPKKTPSSIRYHCNARYDAIETKVSDNQDYKKAWKDIKADYEEILQQLAPERH